MKKLFCMAFALTMAFVASAQQLPDVRVENAEGKTISTRELIGGKPLIISFWSLACKPCIQELNAINDQLDEWREQADFEVIAVSVDDVRMKAAAKAKSRSFGWDFICIFDGNQTLKRAMNVSLTPPRASCWTRRVGSSSRTRVTPPAASSFCWIKSWSLTNRGL